MECGIVTVDLHGRNTYQAKVTVDAGAVLIYFQAATAFLPLSV